jgi:hypothetical protein
MIRFLQESLWKQFGASIDMLMNAVQQCPEVYWQSNQRYCYIAYHTALYLDYYLSMPPTDFSTPLPYTSTPFEEIPAGAVDDSVPNRLYSQQEIRSYLQTSLEKCKRVIAGLTAERLQEKWIGKATGNDQYLSSPEAVHFTVLDILILNLRHVQHHTAQLNLLLRQGTNTAPDWISQTEEKLV